VVKRGIVFDSVLRGGGQERGRRPGASDVIAAAGFGGTCTAVAARLEAQPAIARRRDRLEAYLVERGAVVNGAAGERVATVTNVSIEGRRGQELVAALDVEGLCVASGAACSSGVTEESPVLRAMYPDEPWRARSALRASLGPETTDDEVKAAIGVLELVLGR
jgi:cysteine desulfurase